MLRREARVGSTDGEVTRHVLEGRTHRPEDRRRPAARVARMFGGGGGGGGSRRGVCLSLVALVLAALLTVSSGTQAQAQDQFDKTAVAGTLTAQTLVGARGCENNSNFGWRRCSNNLSEDSFVFDGVTYYIRQLMRQGNNLQLSLALSPDRHAPHVIPEKLMAEGTLRIGGNLFHFSEATTLSSSIVWSNPGFSWSSGQSVQVSLTYFDQEKYEREMRTGASRSGACGEDSTNSLQNDQAGDTPGLWHCHGDVYHYHADWRKVHNPHIATEDLPPVPDANPVAPAPATEPSGTYTRQQPGAPAIKTEGFGDWHTHPDGRFHRHG